MKMYDVIIEPVLSEKSYDGIADKKYVFRVHKDANRSEVKKAIEQIFKVKVEKVNIVNCDGKLKRMGRTQGKTASYKKAYIKLTKDSKAIEQFESLA